MQSRIDSSPSDVAEPLEAAPARAIAPARRPRSAALKRTVLSAMAAMLSALAPQVAHATTHTDEKAKVDVDVDVDVDAKPAPKKPLHKAATKVEAKTSEKTEPRASAKIEVKTPKVDAKARTKVEPKASAKLDVKAPKIDAKVKPFVKASAKVEGEAKTAHKVEKPAKLEATASVKTPSLKAKVDEKFHATASASAHGKKVEKAKVEVDDEVEVAHAHTKTKSKRATKITDDDRVEASASLSSSSKSKRSKTLASREPVGSKKRSPTGAIAKKSAAKKPCYAGRVHVDRGGLEGESFPLTDCDGKPLLSAEERLGVMVRPWGAARPSHLKYDAPPKPNAKGEIAPGVRMVHPGVLTRLEAIAKHFPGKSFSFVSGYRPQSKGSEHQTGRAVDVRVVGVSNEELVAFCKTLKDTGCGYYPNSSFVHVDVRNPKTGSAYWIDASGPGQAPHYVTRWPPPKGESEEAAEPAAPPPEEQSHDDVTTDLMPRRALGEYRDRPVD